MRPTRIIPLLCSLGISSVFAAQPGNEIPLWLRSAGNSNPGSKEVFNAFHSKGGSVPVTPAVEGPILTGAAIYPLEFRSIDGRNNNPTNLGLAGTVGLRTTTVGYGDGSGTPAGGDRLGAREVSNDVNRQDGDFFNSQNISGFAWAWGQFIDHDISLIRVADPAQEFNIPVPKGDPQFDPRSTGTKILPFQRSSSTLVDGVRQQINANSSFLDGSTIYGSGTKLRSELRTLDGYLVTSKRAAIIFCPST